MRHATYREPRLVLPAMKTGGEAFLGANPLNLIYT